MRDREKAHGSILISDLKLQLSEGDRDEWSLSVVFPGHHHSLNLSSSMNQGRSIISVLSFKEFSIERLGESY